MFAPLLFLILNLLLTLLVFFVLWKANYPRAYRYKQILYPLDAFVFAWSLLYFYSQLDVLILPHIIRVFQAIAQFFGFAATCPHHVAEYTAVLLFVLAFALLKQINAFFFSIKLRLIAQRKTKPNRSNPAGKVTFAYKIDVEQEIVLKEEWEFIYIFLSHFAWLTAGLLLLILLALHLFPTPINLPLMLPLALMVICEAVSYLAGPRSRFYDGQISGPPTQSKILGEYTQLWQEYQQRWPSKVLAAQQFRAVPYPHVKSENILHLFKPGEENYEELVLAARQLLKKGFPVTSQDCFILKELYLGNDIIIADPLYNQVAPFLFSSFIRFILSGYNILIIVPFRNINRSPQTPHFIQWVEKWFQQLGGSASIGEIQFFSPPGTINERDKILIAAADDLLADQTIFDPWFANLRAVLFVDVTKVFTRSLTPAGILLSILRERNQFLQCIVISNYRQDLESSVRKNLDIVQGSEIRLLKDKAALTSLLVWQLEGAPSFQQEIFAGDIARFLGAAAVLAVLPWRDNLENIYLYGQGNVCWLEYLEELENTKSSIDDSKINMDVLLSSQAYQRIQCPPVSYLLEPCPRIVLFVHDCENNLVTAFIHGNAYASKENLLHIISPAYLLRQYFADNINYFYKTPIYALTAKILSSIFSLAVTLMEKLILTGLSEPDLLTHLHRVKPAACDAAQELRNLFIRAFDIDIVTYNMLTIEKHYPFSGTEFTQEYFFKLNPTIKTFFQFDWFKKIKIDDPFNNTLDEIYMDHLYQNYLPGQVHTFTQKPYRIEDLDQQSGILRVCHVNPPNISFYRPELTLSLAKIHKQCLDEYRSVECFNNLDMILQLSEATFTITTTGYYYGEGSHIKYKPLERGGKERYYSLGRVLKIDIFPTAKSAVNVTQLSTNLVLLLKEILATFFPETHQYVIVCSSSIDKAVARAHKMLFPQFTSCEPETEKSKAVNLYLFEDSHLDLGLLLSIFDKWKYILKILDDYLTWVLQGLPADPAAVSMPIEKRLYYFQFFTSQVLPFINLEKTSEFLHKCVGDNDLTRARGDFYNRKEVAVVEIPKGIHQCDFCAKPLPAAEVEVLTDGRERCKTCRDTAIDHIESLSTIDDKSLVKVYNDALHYFKKELKLTLRENISIQFATAAEISQHTGSGTTPTVRIDTRLIAYNTLENNGQVIRIENGCPYHLTFAAIVYQLTLIWQSDHLNTTKMPTQERPLLLTGHAVWAQIHCLELKAMAEEYRQEIAWQKNEFGDAYRFISQLLTQHKDTADPFQLLMKLYPAAQ